MERIPEHPSNTFTFRNLEFEEVELDYGHQWVPKMVKYSYDEYTDRIN